RHAPTTPPTSPCAAGPLRTRRDQTATLCPAPSLQQRQVLHHFLPVSRIPDPTAEHGTGLPPAAQPSEAVGDRGACVSLLSFADNSLSPEGCWNGKRSRPRCRAPFRSRTRLTPGGHALSAAGAAEDEGGPPLRRRPPRLDRS